jgi:hypothetical protein
MTSQQSSHRSATGIASILMAALGACAIEPDPSDTTAQELSCETDSDRDGLADCEDPTPDCFTIEGHVGAWEADGTPVATIGPDGVWTGTAAYATGVDGSAASAFSFDGASRVDATPVTVGPNAPWSVSLWVKASVTGQTPKTGVLASGTASVDTFQIEWAAGDVYRFRAGAGELTFPIGAASITAYQHIAVVYDGATGIQAYLDGALVANETWPGGALRITRARIGTNRSGGMSFRGAIDDVRVWSRRLVASEVDSIYTAGGAGVCD